MSSLLGNTIRVKKIDRNGKVYTLGDPRDEYSKALIVSSVDIFPYAFVVTQRPSVGIIKLDKRKWKKQVTHYSSVGITYIERVINEFFRRNNIKLLMRILNKPKSEFDFLSYRLEVLNDVED